MLTSLTVKQFALIEKVELEFESGMTVFTGETGAGKSMLVDALGAVFGSRASSDWVRHGADRAEVVAIWQGEDRRLAALLDEHDIEQDDELMLRRVISKDGRSRAYINGMPVPIKLLQQLGIICLDLHGQHEHQALMQPGFQQQLLDTRLSASMKKAAVSAFVHWQAIQQRLKSLQSERGDVEQQAVWMREEMTRLQALDIETGLVETLQAEVDAGRNHAQIQHSASEALALLDDAEPSVRALLAQADHALAAGEPFHTGLQAARELMDQIDALLGELTPELRAVMDETFDAQQLLMSEERLMALHDAMRRHGCDEEGLLQLMDLWSEKLSALDTAGWDEATITRSLTEAEEAYRCAAGQLSEKRQLCGEELTHALRPFLDRLAMAGMQIRFAVNQQVEQSGWSRGGWDEVVMQVMSNPGEPWRDLVAVASGGELSRLVLALKGCGALDQMPYIAVFDEVDTGIGGETAWCVGELLSSMAKERQVLVISHLPQVASCADFQIVISKHESDGRTVTSLQPVETAQRQQEIARMLGGLDDDARKHAQVMLNRGVEVRGS